MPFWRTAVAPWIRPVHLTVTVSEASKPDATTDGRSGPSTTLVSYAFPGVTPGKFRVTIPQLRAGPASGASRVVLIGNTILLAAREAVRRTEAVSCFLTLGLHPSWRPATVFGSDLSLGSEATARANELFDCISKARLILKVCALPGSSRRAEWKAERLNYKLCPPLWDVLNSRFGPFQWDLMASDANAHSLPRESDAITHYKRWPTAYSSGGNVFSQTLTGKTGLYANPVFRMMLHFLSLVRDQKAQVVVIAPGWDGSVPNGTWWPLLMEFAKDRILLATRGTPGVFLQQTLDERWEPAGPVPWDVWAVCFGCK